MLAGQALRAMRLLLGTGLHGGRPSRVAFVRHVGAAALQVGGESTAICGLELAYTRYATAVKGPRGTVSTVEHAFAALAGAGVWDGVRVELEGDELPLLDGCAASFFDAVDELALEPSRPPLRITRSETIEVEASRYEFSPGDSVRVEVSLEWDDDRLARRASWDGSRSDFRERIAIARTFAFERDISVFAETGLARHVDPESVVVIGEQIHSAGRPFSADEPARHKLLDLVGDAYLYGGPPIGTLVAHRPGHAANHAALSRAVALGVLARSRS